MGVVFFWNSGFLLFFAFLVAPTWSGAGDSRNFQYNDGGGSAPAALSVKPISGSVEPSFNQAIINSETIQKTLSACSIDKGDRREILMQVTQGMVSKVREAQRDCVTSKQDATRSNFIKSIAAIEAETPKQLLVEGMRGITHEQATGFASDLLSQSLSNSMMSYINADKSYAFANKVAIKSVNECVDPVWRAVEFCGDACTEDQRKALSKVATEYQAAMIQKGVKPKTEDQVYAELKPKIDQLNKALGDNPRKIDWDNTHKHDVLSGYREVNPEFYKILRQEAHDGVGLLLYTDSISKVKEANGHILLPILHNQIPAAVNEIKEKSFSGAKDLQKSYIHYRNHHYYGENDLKDMMLSNPIAVGQILVKHPEYALLVCKLAQLIEADDQNLAHLGMAIQAIGYGGFAIGGVLVGTYFLSPLGLVMVGSAEEVFVSSAQGFLMNVSAGTMTTGMAASAGHTYFVQEPALEQDMKTLHQALATRNGSDFKNLQNSENEYAHSTSELEDTLLLLAVPYGLGRSVKFASQVVMDAKILYEIEQAWNAAQKDKWMKPIVGTIDLVCSYLGLTECQYVLATYNHLSPNQKRALLKEDGTIDLAKFNRRFLDNIDAQSGLPEEVTHPENHLEDPHSLRATSKTKYLEAYHSWTVASEEKEKARAEANKLDKEIQDQATQSGNDLSEQKKKLKALREKERQKKEAYDLASDQYKQAKKDLTETVTEAKQVSEMKQKLLKEGIQSETMEVYGVVKGFVGKRIFEANKISANHDTRVGRLADYLERKFQTQIVISDDYLHAGGAAGSFASQAEVIKDGKTTTVKTIFMTRSSFESWLKDPKKFSDGVFIHEYGHMKTAGAAADQGQKPLTEHVVARNASHSSRFDFQTQGGYDRALGFDETRQHAVQVIHALKKITAMDAIKEFNSREKVPFDELLGIKKDDAKKATSDAMRAYERLLERNKQVDALANDLSESLKRARDDPPNTSIKNENLGFFTDAYGELSLTIKVKNSDEVERVYSIPLKGDEYKDIRYFMDGPGHAKTFAVVNAYFTPTERAKVLDAAIEKAELSKIYVASQNEAIDQVPAVIEAVKNNQRLTKEQYFKYNSILEELYAPK